MFCDPPLTVKMTTTQRYMRYKPTTRGSRLPGNVESDVDVTTDADLASPSHTKPNNIYSRKKSASPNEAGYGSLHKCVPLPYQEGVVKCHFQKTLLRIDEDLGSSDLSAIKFICQDHVSTAKLENMERGIYLFQELQNMCIISDGDVAFLVECLLRIQRIDLIKKLGFTKAYVLRYMDENGSRLTSFRLLLYKLCEELTDEDVGMIKFLEREAIPRPKLNSIVTPQQLMTTLIQADSISKNNVDVLKRILFAIQRPDLAGDVIFYIQEIRKTSLPPAVIPEVVTRPLAPTATTLVTPTGYRNVDDEPILPLSSERGNGRGNGMVPNTRSTRRQLHGRYGDNPNSEHNIINTREAVNHSIQIPATVFNEEDEEPPRVIHGLESLSVQQGAAPNNPEPVVEKRIEDEMDLPSYKMEAFPRGKCIIINNFIFYKEQNNLESRMMPERKGSEVDAENLQYLFGNKLDFEVMYHENQTDSQILRIMVDAGHNIDHTTYDCFACCILTHGAIGSIYGVNGVQIPIKDLTSCFRANMCPSLKGKPKLFFIQACQGKEKQEGAPALEEDGDELTATETIPNEADFLLGYATIPGFVSYRSKTHGSWYITKLVEMLDKYHSKYDLMSILIKVNDEVSKANAIMNNRHYKQSPAPLPTLRKRVYFIPRTAPRQQ